MNYIRRREIVVRSRCVGRSAAGRDGAAEGGGRGGSAEVAGPPRAARRALQSVRAVQIGRVVSGIRSEIREEPRVHDRRRRAESIADRRRHRSSRAGEDRPPDRSTIAVATDRSRTGFSSTRVRARAHARGITALRFAVFRRSADG